jgi:hypothetical protein
LAFQFLQQKKLEQIKTKENSMLYKTVFKNESQGRVRLYSDIHGGDVWFLNGGEKTTRQTPDAKNIWAPFAEVKFVVKYPEGTTLTKTKKRKGWKDPFKDEPWTCTFWNGYGLDWEIWNVPGGQSLFLPRGVEVTAEIHPSSSLAKYSRIEIQEPFAQRQMMSLQPGIIRVVLKPNYQYTKRPKEELSKLMQTREWMSKHVHSNDPDLMPEMPSQK